MSSTSLLITDIKNKLIASWSITYIVLGTVGNLLNIVLFAKRNVWKLSPCIPFLLAASVANLIDIYSYVVLRALMGFRISPSTYSSVVCKLQLYVHYTAFGLSSWYMVACCFDRYFSSSPNAVMRSYSNMRVTGRIILIMTTIIPLLYSQTLYCFDANQVNKASSCFPQNDVCQVVDIIYYFLGHALGPPILMFISSVGTFIHIRQGRRITHEPTTRAVTTEALSSITTIRANARRDDRSILIMVTIQVTVYITCSIPLLAMKIYSIITTPIVKSPVQISIENLCQNISILFSLVDKAFSFYIYTLASKYYRTEMIKLFTRCWAQRGVALRN